MSMQGTEADKMYLPMHLVCIFLLSLNLYWNCYGLWESLGWVLPFLDEFTLKLERGRLMGVYPLKGWIFLLVLLVSIVKSGKDVKISWTSILILVAVSCLLFFFPYITLELYLFTTVAGYLMLIISIALLGRKMNASKLKMNDGDDTFEQCTKLMHTDYSVNIPTLFRWKGHMHRGWINCVNPFRASCIMGTPGSGKSYSIYYPFIDQMLCKRFTMFVYDYKFPDLTEIVYNKYLQYWTSGGKAIKGAPKFCVLNFDDPRKSMRCNPLDPMYLSDMSDAHEVAQLIMANINPKNAAKEDFFSMSAKVYIAALIWQLKKYKGGIFCSFPHLIEFMGKDYKKVFNILKQDEEIRIMIQPFADALKGQAQEQLQGQIASARIPLLKFPSPSLYWTLTGSDFTLDINNADDPKIICMGNNPDRQAIYGTALALYTSRMFKVINHKYNTQGKRNLPCGVLLDELPTIFIKGLDNLIATARSNRVAIVLGVQDKSQLIRDYEREEATVILNTVGNIFSGQVTGETARDLSATFGKELREQESETTGGSSNTVSRSFQFQEILPQHKIETLSQGYFFGRVADDNKTVIKKKLFCGEVQANMSVDEKGRVHKIDRQKEEAGFKKIPNFGAEYFHDEEIRAETTANADKYIFNYLVEKKNIEEQKMAAYDPHYNTWTAADINQIVQKEIDDMKPEEKKELLQKVIVSRQEDDMRNILYENYRKIKLDISMMMEEYGQGEDDDEEDKEGGSGRTDQPGEDVGDNIDPGVSEDNSPTESETETLNRLQNGN